MKARKEDDKKRKGREDGIGKGRRHEGGTRRPIRSSLARIKEANGTDHTDSYSWKSQQSHFSFFVYKQDYI